MNKKLDFRIQRTYKLLMNALIELLKEKDFDNITVGELCKHAMIRRATFYKHFADKYELFAFVIREIQNEFASSVDVRTYDDAHPQAFYATVIHDTVDFVEENTDLVKSIFNSRSGQLQSLLFEEIEFEIRMHLKQNQKSGIVLPAKPELMASMMAGALIYSIQCWIQPNSGISKEDLFSACQTLADRL